MIHNHGFKMVEFDYFRMHAGLPNFILSLQRKLKEWVNEYHEHKE